MSNAKIEVYHSAICPYCHAARRLLDSKGVNYELIGVDLKPSLRRTMTERAGGRTSVPQIFVNDEALGGYDDIAALDRDGKLDAVLGIGAN